MPQVWRAFLAVLLWVGGLASLIAMIVAAVAVSAMELKAMFTTCERLKLMVDVEVVDVEVP